MSVLPHWYILLIASISPLTTPSILCKSFAHLLHRCYMNSITGGGKIIALLEPVVLYSLKKVTYELAGHLVVELHCINLI